jgi:hypothetical protein
VLGVLRFPGNNPKGTAHMAEPTKGEIFAAAVAQIYIGIAMARVKGVVCGSPRNIRVRPATAYAF